MRLNDLDRTLSGLVRIGVIIFFRDTESQLAWHTCKEVRSPKAVDAVSQEV